MSGRFLTGLDHMTDARRVWILDYLSIFLDSIVSATGFGP